eukprot:3478498-Rhodomonas_salina.2
MALPAYLGTRGTGTRALYNCMGVAIPTRVPGSPGYVPSSCMHPVCTSTNTVYNGYGYRGTHVLTLFKLFLLQCEGEMVEVGTGFSVVRVPGYHWQWHRYPGTRVFGGKPTFQNPVFGFSVFGFCQY